MKIDELSIDHNALRLITECVENCFTEEQRKESTEYVMGVIDLANALKEVLRE